MVPLKCLINFCITLEIPLIFCEINLILIWFAHFFIIDDLVNNQARAFAITDTKLYDLVVTLLTQDHTKLLQQLKSGSKSTTNWSKYQSKVTAQTKPILNC